MRPRVPVAGGVVVALLMTTMTLAQSRAPWKTPRTADGQPDLQGVWTNATITPLERPARFAGRATLTEQEAREIEAQTAARAKTADENRRSGDVGSYNQFWFDSGTTVVSSRQTSLVVDPPDGRVPLRPEAERIRSARDARETESYEYMSVWDRCITRGVPGTFFPAGYNNAYQIIQTPGYVVIVSEMIHNARIVPLGRPHRPAHQKSMTGDSVGRWEGETLVVDTTNFNDKGWIATNAAAGRIKGVPQSEALHVVERFTRTNAHTISYSVTIDDPQIYTRPWTVSIPLERDDFYRIYEYACHEGNYSVPNILRGARVMDTEKRR